MWTCKECGQQNDGNFCIKCGKKYEEPAPVPVPAPAPVPVPAPQSQEVYTGFNADQTVHPPKKSKAPMIIGIVAGGLVLLAGIITLIVFLATKDNNDVPESTGIYYYVSGVDVYASLYSESDTGSSELARLANGDPVEYLADENSKFVYVFDHFSGLRGYMLADELVTSLDKVDYGDQAFNDGIQSLGDYYVTGTSSTLSLKEGPSGDSNVISSLYNGDMVALLERSSDQYWLVYDYNSGQTGYVLNSYLTSNFLDVQYGDEEVYWDSYTMLGTYYVTGTTNYLAIRSEPSSSSNVEIGKTYNGYAVALLEKTNSTYWYIYDYNSGLYGYVKCAYLTSDYYDYYYDYYYDDYYDYYYDDYYDYYDYYYYDDYYYDDYYYDDYYDYYDDYYYGYYYVSGTTNYLAIRSEPSSSSTVEIGKTYNGNMVLVIEMTNSTYWYIYDYYTGLYGYVKCAYLVQY